MPKAKRREVSFAVDVEILSADTEPYPQCVTSLGTSSPYFVLGFRILCVCVCVGGWGQDTSSEGGVSHFRLSFKPTKFVWPLELGIWIHQSTNLVFDNTWYHQHDTPACSFVQPSGAIEGTKTIFFQLFSMLGTPMAGVVLHWVIWRGPIALLMDHGTMSHLMFGLIKATQPQHKMKVKMRHMCVLCVVTSAPPSQFVVRFKSIIVENVLIPTLQGIILFVRHRRSSMD